MMPVKTLKLIAPVIVGSVIMTRFSSSDTRTLNVIFTSCILASFLVVVYIACNFYIAFEVIYNNSV